MRLPAVRLRAMASCWSARSRASGSCAGRWPHSSRAEPQPRIEPAPPWTHARMCRILSAPGGHPMQARSRPILIAVVALSVALAPLAGSAEQANGDVPGPAGQNRVRLPNGWFLSPAGRQVGVGDFPLGLAVSPDGRLAAVTHSGSHAKGLDLVDLDAGSIVQNVPLDETWLGVTFMDGGRTLAVSAGHTNRILLFPIRDNRAGRPDTIAVGPRWSAGGQYPQGARIDYGPGAIWTTGLSVDETRERLYVVGRLDSALHIVDL